MNFLSPILKGIIGVFALLTPLSYSGHEGLINYVNVDMTGKGYDCILPLIIELSVISGLIYFLRKDLYEVFCKTGSLLKDIKEKTFDIGTKDFGKKLVFMLLFGCITYIFVPLAKFLTKGIVSYLPVVCAGFLVSGYFVARAEKVKEKTLKESNETILNGILVAFFYSFSYIPGFSGIGGMYFAGVLSGFRKETAIKYAYFITLIFTSISFICNLVSLGYNEITINYGIFSYIAAFIGGLGASIGATLLLTHCVKNKKMTGFVFYNAVIAIITLIIWIRG